MSDTQNQEANAAVDPVQEDTATQEMLPAESTEPTPSEDNPMLRYLRSSGLGVIAAQAFAVIVVAAVSYNVGYLVNERRGHIANEQVFEQRMVAQTRIGELEKEVLELKMARLDEQHRRSTIVEVDLEAVFDRLRDRVQTSAAAHEAALEAELPAELSGLLPLRPASAQVAPAADVIQAEPLAEEITQVGELAEPEATLTEASPPLAEPTEASDEIAEDGTEGELFVTDLEGQGLDGGPVADRADPADEAEAEAGDGLPVDGDSPAPDFELDQPAPLLSDDAALRVEPAGTSARSQP